MSTLSIGDACGSQSPVSLVASGTGSQQTMLFAVAGSELMSCTLCMNRLREALIACDGVQEATIDLTARTVKLAFDTTRTTTEQLARKAEQTQNELLTRYAHRTFAVEGMDCPNCAAGYEQTMLRVPGVVSASVQFTSARLRVEYDARNAQVLPRILTQSKELGYTLRDLSEATANPSGPSWSWPVVEATVSGLFLGLGLLAEHAFGASPFITNTLYGLSVLTGGFRFARTGLATLRQGVFGTQLLIALAAVGAMVLGHWEEAAMVIALYAVGLALENTAMERSRRQLSDLMRAVPPTALRLTESQETETIPASELKPGDRVRVLPGANIPADGVIVSGQSAVTEAAITGESVPRDKAAGDSVYAGTLNGNAALTVRVTATGEDSTLARLLHLVEEAQAQKAPVQAFVERFGRIYTPLVLMGAMLVAVLGGFVWGGEDSIYRALTLLVVACPCALVIATPVAYVSAIAGAARQGILVKGGTHLETLADVTQVFVDKTGTLTTGQLQVAQIVLPVSPLTRREREEEEDNLLCLAASVEAQSEHPIARAVVAKARERNLIFSQATEVQAIPGRGLVGTVNGQVVRVGNAALLRENNIALPETLVKAGERCASGAERTRANGESLLFVAVAKEVIGLITVADTLRPEAAETVAKLKASGVAVTMLTGDNATVAQRVAEQVGITEVEAGLLPQDKQHRVVDAVQNGRTVAFVGDGINDAPALASASVGVAMGMGGSATALETADLVLMQSDLRTLLAARRIAKATRQTVRVNVAIAVGTVIVLLGSTLFQHLPLPLGVLGHEGSALLVILNGLRLLGQRRG